MFNNLLPEIVPLMIQRGKIVSSRTGHRWQNSFKLFVPCIFSA